MAFTARLLAAALFLTAPGVAAAADLPAPNSELPPIAAAPAVPVAPEWIVTIGIEGEVVPAWPGAPTSLYGFTGYPLAALRRPGDPPNFFGPRDAFGVPLLDLGAFQLGPAATITFPRYQGRYQQLNGLGDVPWALEVGGYAIYWPVPWLRLRGEVLQGIGGETGETANLFADVVVPFGQWRFSAGPRLTAESAAAVAPYFSITPAQSAGSTISGLPALPVYNASGGFYSYGAGGQTQYFFNQQWSVLGFVEYQRLTGSVAASPLVTMRGSPDQLTFGLGLTYTFAMHPLW
jgi:MipA family protein